MKTDMPPVLYKYKPMNDYTLKIISDGELYFPSIGKLNDPFEGSIPFVFDQSELTTENIFLYMRKLAKEMHPDWAEDEIHQYVLKSRWKVAYSMTNI